MTTMFIWAQILVFGEFYSELTDISYGWTGRPSCRDARTNLTNKLLIPSPLSSEVLQRSVQECEVSLDGSTHATGTVVIILVVLIVVTPARWFSVVMLTRS